MRLIPQHKDLGWTPFAWLVYILPFTLTPLIQRSQANVRGWIVFPAATLLFLVLYFRSHWVRGRDLIVIAMATMLMGVAFWPVSYSAGALFIYAAGMLGELEPARRAMRWVAFVGLVATAQAWFLQRDLANSAWPIVLTMLIGGVTIHFAQVGRANARLRIAREEIEHLAKTAERERIARDLHDLLGHTLSLVILKSELASRLAERDPARAADEIRDVEQISREALAQVRAAVSGYRARGIAAELELARKTFESAGVSLEAKVAELQLSPAHEAVFCLALREAVTNIVRHADASRCALSIEQRDGYCVLTVSDDGRGGDEPFGSGLTGMRERVELLGGTFVRDGRAGTTLRVTLPIAPAEEVRSA
jgi:two-component system sensor histidine kinase DesK